MDRRVRLAAHARERARAADLAGGERHSRPRPRRAGRGALARPARPRGSAALRGAAGAAVRRLRAPGVESDGRSLSRVAGAAGAVPGGRPRHAAPAVRRTDGCSRSATGGPRPGSRRCRRDEPERDVPVVGAPAASRATGGVPAASASCPRRRRAIGTSLAEVGIAAKLALPLVAGGRVLGGSSLVTVGRERAWPDEFVARLQLVAEVLANALGAQGKRGRPPGERAHEVGRSSPR